MKCLRRSIGVCSGDAAVSSGGGRGTYGIRAVHNVAFDAIINRTVLATLGATLVDVHRYANLFTDFYQASQAPHFLLRPPPGWPHAPILNASRGMPAPLRRIHRRLYDIHPGTIKGYASGAYMNVTYGDIIEALRESGECTGSGVALMGAHGQGQVEQTALSGTRDANAVEILSEVLRTIRGQLPGRGEALGLTTVRDLESTPTLVQAIRALLRRAASRGDHTRGAHIVGAARGARRAPFARPPRRVSHALCAVARRTRSHAL